MLCGSRFLRRAKLLLLINNHFPLFFRENFPTNPTPNFSEEQECFLAKLFQSLRRILNTDSRLLKDLRALATEIFQMQIVLPRNSSGLVDLSFFKNLTIAGQPVVCQQVAFVEIQKVENGLIRDLIWPESNFSRIQLIYNECLFVKIGWRRLGMNRLRKPFGNSHILSSLCDRNNLGMNELRKPFGNCHILSLQCDRNNQSRK